LDRKRVGRVLARAGQPEHAALNVQYAHVGVARLVVRPGEQLHEVDLVTGPVLVVGAPHLERVVRVALDLLLERGGHFDRERRVARQHERLVYH
jgi:hypothetical protein